MTLKRTFLKSFVELTGNPFISALLKNFSKSSLSRPLIQPFAKTFQINLDEMEYPITNYKNLHEFFTRRLRKNTRIIDDSSNTLVSPVDGIATDMGKIFNETHLLIKNQKYTITEILGDEYKAAPYLNGYYFILYLSPSHYHRIHFPISGKLIARYALGKKSYPVNDFGLRYGNKPFATNYRLISELGTKFGKIALIKVGALNINSVEVLHSNPNFEKGEELGYFSFGSTVILFIEKTNYLFQSSIAKQTEIKMGQPIGNWTLK